MPCEHAASSPRLHLFALMPDLLLGRPTLPSLRPSSPPPPPPRLSAMDQAGIGPSSVGTTATTSSATTNRRVVRSDRRSYAQSGGSWMPQPGSQRGREDQGGGTGRSSQHSVMVEVRLSPPSIAVLPYVPRDGAWTEGRSEATEFQRATGTIEPGCGLVMPPAKEDSEPGIGEFLNQRELPPQKRGFARLDQRG